MKMDTVIESASEKPQELEAVKDVADARAAGYAHRMAIAKRFGQRVERKDAVFASGAAAGMDMPHTVSNGVAKPITGFNRWMLLQVMNDKGWSDSRFFTPKQIESAGWALKPEAQPVALQFVKTTDSKGLNLAIPEVQRFAVYNAGLIQGAAEADRPPKLPTLALAAAMVEAKFEPGSNLLQSLGEWVMHEYTGHGSHDMPGHKRLVQSMAVSAVLSELELGAVNAQELSSVKALWSSPQAVTEMGHLIAQDPAMFFDAVRVAEQISGNVLTLTRIANIELQAAKSTEKEPLAAAMETTQATEKPPAPSKGLSAYAARLEERFANRQAVLAVPFAEKNKAAALGATWYGPQGVWFVPEGLDLSKFTEWDPRKHHLGKTASTDVIIAEFEKEFQVMGLEVGPKGIVADGQWHNVRVTAKKGKNSSGAYLLDLSRDTPVGQINNKYSGESRPWVYNGPLLTPEQRAKMRALALQRAEIADKERSKAQDTAAKNAKKILAMGRPAYGHAYVHKKGMSPENLLQVPGRVLLEFQEFYGESGKTAIKPNNNYLVLPMQTAAGELRAIQAIGEDGSKSFMRGGQKKGTMTVLGAPSLQSLCERISQTPQQLFLASFVEGFATGHSLHSASNEPVVICWDAGNLQTVVSEAAAAFPENIVPILAVDNDQFFAERALGFLSTQVGVNPNSDRGSSVEVFSGHVNTRCVSLGDAIANGEWHQAPGGRYRMNLLREQNSTEVIEIEVSVLPTGKEIATTNRFKNSGVESGLAAMQVLNDKAPKDMLARMLIPEFRSLNSRPTDWNDLHKVGGLQAVQTQFQDCLQRAGLFKEPPQQARTVQREAAHQSTGMER